MAFDSRLNFHNTHIKGSLFLDLEHFNDAKRVQASKIERLNTVTILDDLGGNDEEDDLPYSFVPLPTLA